LPGFDCPKHWQAYEIARNRLSPLGHDDNGAQAPGQTLRRLNGRAAPGKNRRHTASYD